MAERLIGMLIFPRLTQLDMTGPYEVLARLPNTKVHLVAHTMAPVKTDRGMEIVPTVTLADCPQLDLVMVPGGAGQQDLMEDAVVLEFLRKQAAGAKYVTSVCTGSLVLGAAGLLKGKRATCHWSRDRAPEAARRHPGEPARRHGRQHHHRRGRRRPGSISRWRWRRSWRARRLRNRSSCRSNMIRRRRSIPARPRRRRPRRSRYCGAAARR